MARWVAIVAGAATIVLTARPAVAQDRGDRFVITQVGDSTFVFATAGQHWVRSGMQGVAVDPLHRDILVARFRVVRVARDSALAFVTGQTTRLTTDHVALLVEPSTPWYRQTVFWLGSVLGGIIGAVIAHQH